MMIFIPYFVKRIFCFILSVQMCLLCMEMCSLYDKHLNRFKITFSFSFTVSLVNARVSF